ncbi:MAG TPA: helix-turn-helix transcriptional regulator [Candidatus Gallacutalibacter stercoravium]|nr:helix-turn-helix transcriptional regulator [Candidatus Gallacutalibacter stercoravium]
METRIMEIAERIRALREIMDFSVEEMAQALHVTQEEYLAHENGEQDFNFTFLYNCADKFGVDIVELLTGENPRLSFYSVMRAGEGLDIKRRKGFKYEHLNYRFKDKIAETFLVTAPYLESEQNAPIHLSTHEGQEFDYILSGSLKARMEDHIEVLNAGDAIYYDSSRGHGMIATGGQECVFLAVVMRAQEEGEDKPHD